MIYTMSCGCKFKQFGENVKESDGLPSIEIDYYNLHHCPRTWQLLGTGFTKGIFQLEKQLGQHWSKEISPWDLEDLSAILALVRPGCLSSFVNGKSITQTFADRKNGKEEDIPFHPALENILKDTHQVITYQEQILRIANEIAGFTLGEADSLRKSIGSKDSKLMQSLKVGFIEGCIKTGKVDEKTGKDLFDMIEKSQNYLFNKSHSLAYAVISEWTGLCKSHFPLHFFTSFLQHSEDKLDKKQEIKELIQDFKNFDLKISPPKLSNSIIDNYGRFCMNDGNVDFGIASIKGLGRSHIQKLYNAVKVKINEKNKKIEKFTWMEFLCEITDFCSSTVINNLIVVGACPDFGVSRKRKAYEYKIYSELTDREKEWVKVHYSQSFIDTLDRLSYVDRKNGGPANEKRRESIKQYVGVLQNPPASLDDAPEWIINNEREMLGISLSYNIMDTKTVNTDYTCSDFLLKKNGKINIACEISSFRETIIKNGSSAGKKMAFITISDQTGNVNAVCFADVFESVKNLLFEGNTIICSGFRSKKNEESLTITDVKQL